MSAITLSLPFLPDLPLDALRLLDHVVTAHQAETARGLDLSTQVFRAVMIGSGSVTNAVAAAILSAGGQHGPIGPARFIYETADREKVQALMGGAMGPGMRRVPGFGHSVFKDQVDPCWVPVKEYVEQHFVGMNFRLRLIEAWVNEFRMCERPLFPNGTLYTAAMCSELKVPRGLELVIPLLARLPVGASEVN